jgi:hypothetical protein
MISVSGDDDDEVSGEMIYRYTAQDAVREGVFVPVGSVGNYPVYFTSMTPEDH